MSPTKNKPNRKPIRVLIADDHTLVREGMCLLLEDQPDFRVVAEASNGLSAVQKAEEVNPDLALLDISMPDLDGIEALGRMLARQPQMKVLMLTMHEDQDLFFKALQAGASGYVLKGSTSGELIEALRVVAQGEVYLSPKMTSLLVKHFTSGSLFVQTHQDEPSPETLLSKRELEVLKRLAEGQKNAEIAQSLVISPSTVQTHRRHIFKKLGLGSRSDLVKYALRHGLITLE